MRFKRLRLQNFKCYADADLELDPGVTVVHGVNGSGKSTLLQACFFALYGSKALEEHTLDDVITRGADDAEVELWFDHGGEAYRVERRLRLVGDDDRAQTARCVLEGPDGTIEGARAVRSRVSALVRMDANAFVNCAYVRQGEVNKLIHASPSDRRDMIDELLQLGTLEEYRQRASDARLGVKTVLDGRREVLADLTDRIEKKEEADLHARLNDLRSRLSEVDAEIERLEDQRATAEDTREEAVEIIETYADRRERLSELESSIAAVRERIAETERERERLQSRIADLREQRENRREERDDLLAGTDLDAAESEAVERRLAELESRDDELGERLQELQLRAQQYTTAAENHRETAADLERDAEEARTEADRLLEEVEAAEATLVDRRETLSELDEQIEAERRRFEDAPVALGEVDAHLADLRERREGLAERRTDLKAELETARAAVSKAEALLADGKCPECGQPVEDSPHVERLEDDRERVRELEADLDALDGDLGDLDERIERAERLGDAETEIDRLEARRENVRQLLDEKESTLADKRERIEQLREDADEAEASAEREREAAAEAEADVEEVREQIAESNRERAELAERIDGLEALADALAAIADAGEEIERLREKRSMLGEQNDERRETLAEKREERDDLRAEYDEGRLEEAREERDRAEAYIERVEDTLADLREEHDDLQNRVGGVQAELSELEDLRERREDVAARVQALESLYEEAENLQGMYGDLRAELRQGNVERLERMLNETFDLVYGNDAYAAIELDGEYELTVYQKDGQPLDPEQLSGGERALFNLSLRCAIYRLLAAGIDGAAPMPPLILDEPTVFLDAGHVTRLVELIEAMRDHGVEQILVVSHDEQLLGAADAAVSVEKDPTSNRSSVGRERAPSVVAE